MPGFRNKRFTIYDAMESYGTFDQNPANQSSRDPSSGESLYKGPVEYPKMLYHPKGETKILMPGEWVDTKQGVKLLGEQRALIDVIVKNEEEEQQYLENGWHDHPAKAIAAAGGIAPPMSSAEQITKLEAELRKLKAQSAPTAQPLPRQQVAATPQVVKTADVPTASV